MILDNKIVFHLGLPRTGTTFLQESIFPKINGINYLLKPSLINFNYDLSKKKKKFN